MKKFLLTELIIAAIYTAYMSYLWSGISSYIGSAIGVLIFSIGIGYIIAACCTRKSPQIHETAFVIFCIILIFVGYQNKSEKQLIERSISVKTISKDDAILNNKRPTKTPIEKELKEGLIEFDKVTQDYKVNDITTEKLEEDIRVLTDGLVKTMAQEMLSYSKKINVPDPMLNNPNFLKSKEDIAVAISKQKANINNYKKEIKSVIDDMMLRTFNSFVSECKEKYTNGECEKVKEQFKHKIIEAQNKIYAMVPIYIDYLEEELDVMLFIENNYNKFTTSGKYPHFVDSTLQNQFIKKVQEIDRKGHIVNDVRSSAWQNSHENINKI